MTRRRAKFLLLASLLAGLVGASRVIAASRIVGTDLLGVEFTKVLYVVGADRGLELALTFDGSRPGVQALKLGRADAALLLLPSDEAAELREFHVEPVAYQRVLVLVREDCPLPHITLAQLSAIFGTRSGMQTEKTWGGIGSGDAGAWSAEAILPIAPEVGQGIALDLFRHVVLAGGEVSRTVVRYRTAAELVAHFKEQPRGIALAGAMPRGAHRLKALPVLARGDEAAAPTAEGLARGDYALGLPLLFVARRDAVARLQPIVAWLRSEAGSEALAGAELLAAPWIASLPDARK